VRVMYTVAIVASNRAELKESVITMEPCSPSPLLQRGGTNFSGG
jgi:hypothetical protein